MDDIYRKAMKAQVGELAEDMDELYQLVSTGQPVSRVIYRAVERNLQLLTEACIGIAKHSLKGMAKEVPSDARQAFAKLRQLGLDHSGADWNRIIGMRNALVHAYLNLDAERVLDVVRQRRYQVLLDFAAQRLADAA